MKIWRKVNKLDFPSMYLELYTLNALHGKWSGKTHLMNNFISVLEHISQYFSNTAIYDPSNSNNVISHILNKNEKEKIRIVATQSLCKDYLSQIIF